jgi:hypothetical protein
MTLAGSNAKTKSEEVGFVVRENSDPRAMSVKDVDFLILDLPVDHTCIPLAFLDEQLQSTHLVLLGMATVIPATTEPRGIVDFRHSRTPGVKPLAPDLFCPLRCIPFTLIT